MRAPPSSPSHLGSGSPLCRAGCIGFSVCFSSPFCPSFFRLFLCRVGRGLIVSLSSLLLPSWRTCFLFVPSCFLLVLGLLVVNPVAVRFCLFCHQIARQGRLSLFLAGGSQGSSPPLFLAALSYPDGRCKEGQATGLHYFPPISLPGATALSRHVVGCGRRANGREISLRSLTTKSTQYFSWVVAGRVFWVDGGADVNAVMDEDCVGGSSVDGKSLP